MGKDEESWKKKDKRNRKEADVEQDKFEGEGTEDNAALSDSLGENLFPGVGAPESEPVQSSPEKKSPSKQYKSKIKHNDFII